MPPCAARPPTGSSCRTWSEGSLSRPQAFDISPLRRTRVVSDGWLWSHSSSDWPQDRASAAMPPLRFLSASSGVRPCETCPVVEWMIHIQPSPPGPDSRYRKPSGCRLWHSSVAFMGSLQGSPTSMAARGVKVGTRPLFYVYDASRCHWRDWRETRPNSGNSPVSPSTRAWGYGGYRAVRRYGARSCRHNPRYGGSVPCCYGPSA